MAVRLNKVIGIGDMLHDIANGLGYAHHTLWDTSKTPIGTLAVKDAEIKIEFEMSSRGSSRNDVLDLPGGLPVLGAKTFSLGSTTLEASKTNHATLTVKIVNVMPSHEDPKIL